MPGVITLYLLGFTLNPGLWGGCAMYTAPAYQGGPLLATMECTYGAVAECTRETLKACQVPVYNRELSSSERPVDAGQALAELVREQGPSVLGPVTRYATANEISRDFTSKAYDKRPEDQRGKGVTRGK